MLIFTNRVFVLVSIGRALDPNTCQTEDLLISISRQQLAFQRANAECPSCLKAGGQTEITYSVITFQIREIMKLDRSTPSGVFWWTYFNALRNARFKTTGGLQSRGPGQPNDLQGSQGIHDGTHVSAPSPTPGQPLFEVN